MITPPTDLFVVEPGPTPELPIIRFIGHNVALDTLLRSYRAGKTAEQLSQWYDSLPAEMIQRALRWYHSQQAAIDPYLDACQAYLDHIRQTTPKSPAQCRIEQFKRERGFA